MTYTGLHRLLGLKQFWMVVNRIVMRRYLRDLSIVALGHFTFFKSSSQVKKGWRPLPQAIFMLVN